jgi:hypothetical protein
LAADRRRPRHASGVLVEATRLVENKKRPRLVSCRADDRSAGEEASRDRTDLRIKPTEEPMPEKPMEEAR